MDNDTIIIPCKILSKKPIFRYLFGDIYYVKIEILNIESLKRIGGQKVRILSTNRKFYKKVMVETIENIVFYKTTKNTWKVLSFYN